MPNTELGTLCASSDLTLTASLPAGYYPCPSPGETLRSGRAFCPVTYSEDRKIRFKYRFSDANVGILEGGRIFQYHCPGPISVTLGKQIKKKDVSLSMSFFFNLFFYGDTG